MGMHAAIPVVSGPCDGHARPTCSVGGRSASVVQHSCTCAKASPPEGIMPRSNPVSSLFPCCMKHFSTPREVVILDPRLVCVYSSLATCVLLYVIVFQLLLHHGYATFEHPIGHINLWPGLSTAWPDGDEAPNSLPVFCSNASYNWGDDFTPGERQVTGGFKTINASCRGFSPMRDMVVESNTMTVVTHERADELGEDGSVIRSTYTYTGSPEGAVANAIHVYSLQSRTGAGVDNVRTIVNDARGNLVRKFDNGDIITGITLKDWMSFAGVDLERVNVQSQVNVHPFFRTTGLVLLIRMTYTNLRPFHLPVYDPLCTVTVEALPQAWGFLGAKVVPAPRNSTATSLALQQTGVRMIFIQSGTIGTFDIVQLVLRLVEGTVLFSIARFATDFVGELPCCLGRRFVRRTSDEVTTAGHTTPGCFCMLCSCGKRAPAQRGKPGDATGQAEPVCGAGGWFCACGMRRCRLMGGCCECGVPLLPGGEEYDSALLDEQMAHPIKGSQRRSKAAALLNSGVPGMETARAAESETDAKLTIAVERTLLRKRSNRADGEEDDGNAPGDDDALFEARRALRLPVRVPPGAVGCCSCLGSDDPKQRQSLLAMSLRSGLVRRSEVASARRSSAPVVPAPQAELVQASVEAGAAPGDHGKHAAPWHGRAPRTQGGTHAHTTRTGMPG